MALAVGQVVEGTVSNILKFGAFIDLGEGKSGLVHISEVSDAYVENISDFLEKGQKVKVKILSLDDRGKISLSMKKAISKPTIEKNKKVEYTESSKKDVNLSFEDKLSKFLKDSNEKIEKSRSRENFKMSKNRSRNK